MLRITVFINGAIRMYQTQSFEDEHERSSDMEVYNANEITPDDMYVVWFCKTLQNWKALVSGVHIKEYIEVTYNGDKQEIYVDVYQKACNECLKDGGDEDCQ